MINSSHPLPAPAPQPRALKLRFTLVIHCLLACMLLVAPLNAETAQEPQADRDEPAPTVPAPSDAADAASVKVGKLSYGGGVTSVCFADRFLALVDRETEIDVQRAFDSVRLDSEDIFNYPFLVLTGQQSFTLSETEATHLRRYLERGGFILASAGCSNQTWARSFEAAMKQVVPEHGFAPLPEDHSIYRIKFRIESLRSRKPTDDPAILGLELNRRLVVVYSPLGLNDTANAGDSCCCCGGNEIRDAQQINANILIHALTH